MMVRDIAVLQGKIAAVEKNIAADQAGKVVDVFKRCTLLRAIIDIHYHIGHAWIAVS
jgi:dihydroorotase-like cyclic amidohydrolase